MTRLVSALALASAAIAYFDPAGLRWAGVAALVLMGAYLTLKVHRHARRQAARETLEGLRALHPGDFEAEVGRWLRRDGWDVEICGGTGDGGIDILARKHDETVAIQCKRYAENAAVSAAQVRDLYGAAIAKSATGAVLVTTGRVSAPAIAWAEALPDGAAIHFHDRDCLAQCAAGRRRIA